MTQANKLNYYLLVYVFIDRESHQVPFFGLAGISNKL